MARPAGTSTANPAAPSHSVWSGRSAAPQPERRDRDPEQRRRCKRGLLQAGALQRDEHQSDGRRENQRGGALEAAKARPLLRSEQRGPARSEAPGARGGSRNSAASSAAMRTAAVPMRAASWPFRRLPPASRLRAARWCGRSGARGCGRKRWRASSAARVEVGPQRVGEVELGVGELPQQEIADALLAAGADEEVRLRRVAHREIRRQRRLVEPGRGELWRSFAQHALSACRMSQRPP